MQKSLKGLEKFFWLYLLFNPVLDIVNGLYIWMLTRGYAGMEALNYRELTNSGGMTTTPALIVRMLVLVVMVVYVLLLRDRRSILTALPMGAAWAMSVLSEFLWAGSVNLSLDVTFFARFAYNVAVAMVYLNVFRRAELSQDRLIEKVHAYVNGMTIIFSLGILIPYVLRIGYSTYYDRFGARGVRGFYYSGNDITGALMILLPLAIAYFLFIPRRQFTRGRMLLYSLGPAMSIVCLMLIGTKTALIAMIVESAVMLVYAVAVAVRGSREMLRRAAILAVITVIVALIFNGMSLLLSGAGRGIMDMLKESMNAMQEAANEEGGSLISGRWNKLAATLADFKAAGPIAWLFGVGRGSQGHIIEMDLFDVGLLYGVFGFVAMTQMYIRYGVQFLMRMVKNWNVLVFGAFVSLGITVAYLAVAGHILFTVTSGFFFAFVLVYARMLTTARDRL